MAKNSANNVVDSLKSYSQIFEESKKYLDGAENLSDKLSGLLENNALVAILLVCLFACFIKAAWHLWRLIFLYRWKSRSQRNSFFFSSVFACFFSGLILYYYGYDYAGTYKNGLTLLLRSTLSSFEMFLSKSNLIGIAENCKNSHWYMLAFACVHTVAVILSAIFAVACFWKRIRYWVKSQCWGWFCKNETTYVFWGLNERSYMLAKDLHNHRHGKERIVFVSFPETQDENNKSQGFSGLIGLLSFKLKVIRQIESINYVLFRSSARPSEYADKGKDFFDEMDLMQLKRILRRSDKSCHFIFTDNESSNLKAAMNMLQTEMFNDRKKTKLYCAVRKTRFSKLIEEKYEGQLKIIDDSRMSINSLKRSEVGKSQPIDYVEVDYDKAVVESCFTSLIIGFGTTGQDALRFLYEFSAFPDSDGNKSPVKIHVVDNKMNQLRGDYLQEVPAMEDLEGKEIMLHHMDIGSKEFFELLRSIAQNLNYVIIAAGNDALNIEIATRLLEMVNQSKDESLDHFHMFVRLYNEENKVKFEEAIDVYKPFALSLTYFGSTESLYKKDFIISDRIKDDAEEFHKAYCDANAGENYVTLEERLDQERRKSDVGPLYAYRSLERKESQNKANRMHVYTKIKLLGIDKNPNNVVLPKWDDKTGFDNCKVDKAWTTKLTNVSICEHLRWNASHLMMGYLPMTDEVKKQNSGTCNVRKRMHTCIVDWNKLDKLTQKYDYYVVKTSVYQYLKGKATINIE